MNPRLHRPGRIRRGGGFLTLDVLMGLAMGTLVLMSLSAAIVKEKGAEKRLAVIRAATRQADGMLLQMQAGASPAAETILPEMPPGASPPTGARVEKLPDPAPPGRVWVRLTLRSHDNMPSVSLVGLVPAKTLDGGTRR